MDVSDKYMSSVSPVYPECHMVINKIVTNNLENNKAVFVTEVAGAFTERLEWLYLIIILLIML